MRPHWLCWKSQRYPLVPVRQRHVKPFQPAALLAITLAAILTTAGPVWTAGGGLLEGFRDPVDGAIDASDWLLNKRGVLVVPIIITEPRSATEAEPRFFCSNAPSRTDSRPKSRPMSPWDCRRVSRLPSASPDRDRFSLPGAIGHIVTNRRFQKPPLNSLSSDR